MGLRSTVVGLGWAAVEVLSVGARDADLLVASNCDGRSLDVRREDILCVIQMLPSCAPFSKWMRNDFGGKDLQFPFELWHAGCNK